MPLAGGSAGAVERQDVARGRGRLRRDGCDSRRRRLWFRVERPSRRPVSAVDAPQKDGAGL